MPTFNPFIDIPMFYIGLYATFLGYGVQVLGAGSGPQPFIPPKPYPHW